MSEKALSRFIPLGLIRTQEQIDIQMATCKVLLVEANAGAAKTTTLALRIGEALAANVAPESILALVFTETARDVMRQRLLDLGVHIAIVNRITIATFEEFARTQLAKVEDRHVKQYSSARLQSKTMLAAIDKVYEHYHDKVECLQLHTHNVALTQFLDAQLALKARMQLDPDVELEDLETVFDRLGVTETEYLAAVEYERIRLGYDDQPVFRGPFDATYDLARDVARGSDAAVLFDEYRLVVCDELHDLNEAAFRILCALIGTLRCYFVGAGDKDQVIHATLGASHEFLESRFKERFPGTKKYPLTITYRHGPHLAYSMAAFKNKVIESHVASELEIKVGHYDGSAEAGAGEVVKAIKQWKKDGYPLDACTILIRDRHQSIAIENALRLSGIGYRTPVMGSYLQREEILFLRGVIGIALGGFDAVKSPEVKAAVVEALDLYGGLAIERDALEDAKKGIAKHAQLHWFYERYICPDPSREARSPLDAAIRFVKEAGPDMPAAVVLEEVCKRMRLAESAVRLYVRPYDAAVVVKSIAGFLDMARSGAPSLQQFWDAVNAAESFASRKRESGVVTLDCVANAKGKEFEHVIMPFLEVKEFPNPLFQRGEEENLFYVGATCARARLTLITPSEQEQRSPFSAAMKIAGISARANLAVQHNENRSREMPPSRHYLRVSYADKDLLKSMGARFDGIRKAWYVPAGLDRKPFEPWL
jgi:DNA helicase-2/ATP-dependent DNA helicase PcrA